VEQWQPPEPFDLVVSRAFADLSDFVNQAKHLARPGGTFLAMKGVYPFEEIGRVPASHRVSKVVELAVPTLDAKRHLVFVEAA
jgi:16S rRNA (guanine527-N7)-methyltransferase